MLKVWIGAFAVTSLMSCSKADDASTAVATVDPTGPASAAMSDPATTIKSAAVTTPVKMNENGDTAVWSIENGLKLVPTATSFIARVSRLGCSGGVTGEVLGPVISTTSSEIVVTFEVESLPLGDQTCPGNDLISVGVDLGEPIGNRSLIAARASRRGGGYILLRVRANPMAAMTRRSPATTASRRSALCEAQIVPPSRRYWALGDAITERDYWTPGQVARPGGARRRSD